MFSKASSRIYDIEGLMGLMRSSHHRKQSLINKKLNGKRKKQNKSEKNQKFRLWISSSTLLIKISNYLIVMIYGKYYKTTTQNYKTVFKEMGECQKNNDQSTNTNQGRKLFLTERGYCLKKWHKDV